MATVGRNDPCPCKSGRKYKKCHGSFQYKQELEERAKIMFARSNAERIQRENQQGLGKPIISAELNDHRFVAVNNRLLYSNKWRTFHDFLIHYIKSLLEPEWGKVELNKPSEAQHTIIKWFQLCGQHMQAGAKLVNNINTAAMTGAIHAFLHLANDLYALEHNVELQKKFLNRLKNHEEFSSARYELYVAASFIRAGFDIAFEDEDNRDITHCEFVATHRKSGKKYSVEAKRRESRDFRIIRLLNNALKKAADHDRIVFIDLNEPVNTEADARRITQKALRLMRSEENALVNGNVRPPAYVFITNTPWEHFLNETSIACIAMTEGFRISDFKHEGVFPSLRDAIIARDRHIEMHELMRSIQQHSAIPATFDGDNPMYALNPGLRRFLIGERYTVPDSQGNARSGVLTSAVVTENNKTAHCAILFDDNTTSIYSTPLTDDEFAAWQAHPDTFFGDVRQYSKNVNGPLEMYDFFHQICRESSKQKLLESFAAAPDLADLKDLDQPQLASLYAERMTYSLLELQKAQADTQA